VALYKSLQIAIYDSQGLIAPEAWRKRFAPVLVSLQALLALVDPAVARKAAQFHVRLPTVE